VTRDIDLLAQLARHNAAVVFMSVTTLDPDLARIMEPRTSQPAARLRAVAELTAAGIPAGVFVAPVIPGLTESRVAIHRQSGGGGRRKVCGHGAGFDCRSESDPCLSNG